MINTYNFDYTYNGKTHTKTIVAVSYKRAIEKGEMFLEELNDDLDLLGLESWEDVQDACDNVNIIVDDLIEVIE